MKKYWTLALMGATFTATANQDLTTALSETNFSLDTRAFYMKRTYDSNRASNFNAFTLGGIAKAETGKFYGAQVGAAYYGSFRLLTDKDDARAKPALATLDRRDGSNLSFIGELYYKQTVSHSSFTFGRQRLNTPLANDHDLRLLPTVYEAAVLDINELENNQIQLGYIASFSQLGSRFNRFDDAVSSRSDKGLGYIYWNSAITESTNLRAQYAWALNNKRGGNLKDYSYLDITHKMPQEITLKAQVGANRYANESTSKMFGAAVEKGLDDFALGAVFNHIKDNNFNAIESGPMYTDWQQGYGERNPLTAYGAYAVYKGIDNLSIRLGAVKAKAKKSNQEDDFLESNLDLWYTFSKTSKFRLRYSDKRMDSASSSGKQTRRDFRAVYYLSF